MLAPLVITPPWFPASPTRAAGFRDIIFSPFLLESYNFQSQIPPCRICCENKINSYIFLLIITSAFITRTPDSARREAVALAEARTTPHVSAAGPPRVKVLRTPVRQYAGRAGKKQGKADNYERWQYSPRTGGLKTPNGKKHNPALAVSVSAGFLCLLS